MMTHGVPWQLAYGGFSVALVSIGWITYVGLKFFENRKLKSKPVTSKRDA